MPWAWDPRKDDANQRKHGVSFALAALVFADPLHLSEPDPHPDGDRWITMGRVDPAVLLVVHTLDTPDLAFGRIISARRATKHERKRYEEGL